MKRTLCGVLMVLTFGTAFVMAAEETVLVDEDFESGLGAWTTVVYAGASGENNNTPIVFPASGAGIYGDNTGYPGSKSVGFASSLYPWDGQQPQWIAKQWENVLAEGTYHVTVTVDRYAYSFDEHDYWGLGNRIYILTDTLYDDNLVPYDNNPFPPAASTGDGIRGTQWLGDAPNGQWVIGATVEGDITTTTGNLELRLLMHEKYAGPLTCAWDNVTVSVTDESETEVLSFSDDFENGLNDKGWVTRLYGPPKNDDPRLFAADDADLYRNISNPGSASAGYSSNQPAHDGTTGAWIQQQFPGAVPPGTYNVVMEFDAYTYKSPEPNNDVPVLFDAAGTGMYGDNNPYSGQTLSQSVGYSSNLAAYDGTAASWLQQQFPAAVVPGTYDVHVEADVYVYKSAGDFSFGNRIYVLTDGRYNDQTFGPDGDPLPGLRLSKWNQDGGTGNWIHVDELYTGATAVTTATGDLEFRLLMHDKSGGAQTTAWDNVHFTVTDPQTNAIVFELSDDFESGWDAWTLVPRTGADPWGVGNRVFMLTDDYYNDPSFNFDTGSVPPGFQWSQWPGWHNEEGRQDWTKNGLWQHISMEQEVATLTGNFEVRLLMHDKNAGAQAIAWDNIKLTVRIPAPPCNDPWFDFDGDGDVDQDDFAQIQACMTGMGDPGVLFDTEACACMDPDGDLDVDSTDLVLFEACASGPDVAADPACDSQACCMSESGCEDFVPAICEQQGGTPQGQGTSCASTSCP